MGENKEKGFDEKTERQMAERVVNFLGALKSPMRRIGEKRAQRKANPDFVAPEPKVVERFEQKNREDRWSKTVYGADDYGDGVAKIRVQDPGDPGDVELDPIHPDGPNKHRVKGNEELRELHPEKVTELQIPDEEEDEETNG